MSSLKKKSESHTLKHLFLLCFLAVTVWAINLYFHPGSPAGSDAAFHAATARNIVQGHGFKTPATIPAFLANSIPLSPFGWPALVPHLYPLMVAIFFWFFGINDFSLALTSGFFFVLTIPFCYLLAKKLFNKEVACLACLWYIFTPSILNYSVWGATESLFIFLITLGLFFLIACKDCFFWAGVVFGFSYLTKFQGILLFPPFFIYIFKTKKQLSSIFLFLGGFILILAFDKFFLPPLVTNYASFQNHHLWTTIAQGAIFPKNQAGRTLTPFTFNLLLSNLNLVFGKVFSNLYYFLQNFFSLTLPSVTFLYLLSFFKPAPSKTIKNFKILSLVLILVFLSFYLVTYSDFRYLHPLLPLVLIIAAQTFWLFLKQFNPKRLTQLTAIFTFLFVVIPCFTAPFWGTNIQRRLARPQKPTFKAIFGKIVQENTPPEAIIVSEAENVVAWQGNRRAIRFPLTLADLEKIDQEIVPVDAIFLSSHPYREPIEPEWQELIDKPHDFGNFYFAKKFEIKPEDNYYRIPVEAVLYLKKEKLGN